MPFILERDSDLMIMLPSQSILPVLEVAFSQSIDKEDLDAVFREDLEVISPVLKRDSDLMIILPSQSIFPMLEISFSHSIDKEALDVVFREDVKVISPVFASFWAWIVKDSPKA